MYVFYYFFWSDSADKLELLFFILCKVIQWGWFEPLGGLLLLQSYPWYSRVPGVTLVIHCSIFPTVYPLLVLTPPSLNNPLPDCGILV